MTDSSRLVSVIIPVFNGEGFLGEVIASALSQTYRPIEIVVVDDGSTDRSGDVARGFNDPGVRYFYQPNSGAGAARNQGTNLARGSYFAFLDHDDIWLPDKLTLQMAAFDDDPELDIVFGLVSQFYDFESDEPPNTTGEPEGGLLRGCYPSAMLIKRESFGRVGPFATDWQVGEFVDWYAKAAEKGLKSHMLPKLVTKRRIHSANTVIQHRDSQGDYVRILKQALDRRREKGSQSQSH